MRVPKEVMDKENTNVYLGQAFFSGPPESPSTFTLVGKILSSNEDLMKMELEDGAVVYIKSSIINGVLIPPKGQKKSLMVTHLKSREEVNKIKSTLKP